MSSLYNCRPVAADDSPTSVRPSMAPRSATAPVSTNSNITTRSPPATLEQSQFNDLLVSQDGAILGVAFSNGKRLALRFDMNGTSTVQEVSRNEILKLIHANMPAVTADKTLQERLSGNSLHSPASSRNSSRSRSRARFVRDAPVEIPAITMRDLRKLDNVFSASNEPTITVRHQAILVHCDPIRAVILCNACFVFLPDGADSLVLHLQRKFEEHLHDAEAFEFAYDSDMSLCFTRRHRALEAILATICRVLTDACDKILPLGRASLEKMAQDISMLRELQNLRAIKNDISLLESQMTSVLRFLCTLLENEADMRMLYLTKLYEQPTLALDVLAMDADESESLVEAYIQEVHSIQTAISLMANNIRNTESISMIKLDTKRNSLLSIDMSMTLMGTVLAVPTFIVGQFGTSLHSQLEQTDGLFYVVFACCAAFIVLAYLHLVRHLEKQGVNMSWTQK
ncbi:Aste57867_22114 [Aphanomyces stellatus]|uniref:Magnesium transporter n=1 Tax=Aphanomyces stellatus TaxID=120398 RepID=A0A485LJK9_9STRA|nr:hypothetical protein As57867_022045 [Aphanomyces stellatus]VFT98782.1 Aste57867_22114 [Aphanomyces stellatus]